MAGLWPKPTTTAQDNSAKPGIMTGAIIVERSGRFLPRSSSCVQRSTFVRPEPQFAIGLDDLAKKHAIKNPFGV
jgi:hypothetical protein